LPIFSYLCVRSRYPRPMILVPLTTHFLNLDLDLKIIQAHFVNISFALFQDKHRWSSLPVPGRKPFSIRGGAVLLQHQKFLTTRSGWWCLVHSTIKQIHFTTLLF